MNAQVLTYVDRGHLHSSGAEVCCDSVASRTMMGTMSLVEFDALVGEYVSVLICFLRWSSQQH